MMDVANLFTLPPTAIIKMAKQVPSTHCKIFKGWNRLKVVAVKVITITSIYTIDSSAKTN